MLNIQKTNPESWWVGTSPKHHIQKRIHVPGKLTDEEVQQHIRNALKKIDEIEDKKIEEELYRLSDEYPRSKLQHYKYIELEALKKQLQTMNDNNNSRFAGGYTGPSIMDHKAEVDRIKKFEETKKAEIEKKFDGSKESLEYVRKLMMSEVRPHTPKIVNVPRLVPRVGGARARHAMEHGGGFNHRGVYAPNVFK